MKTVGTLYGIGVGPGASDLIAVRGANILRRVAVVAFPAGADGTPGLAARIAEPWLSDEQRHLALDFPFVRVGETSPQENRDRLHRAWQEAAERVGAFLLQGEDVAFLTEGDASFYSTFSYLARAVARSYPQVPVEVVPGISSPAAAAAAAGVPLVCGDERLAILPALYSLEALEAAIAWADAIVLLKVGSVYPQVRALLEAKGLLDRAWAIERATQSGETLHANLRQLPARRLPYFSLLYVRVRDREC